MGIVQTKLGDQSRKEWFKNHPKFHKVKSKNIKLASEMHEITNWVKENTDGHSTAELNKFHSNDKCFHMIWFFENEIDAVLFKLTWS